MLTRRENRTQESEKQNQGSISDGSNISSLENTFLWAAVLVFIIILPCLQSNFF